MDCDDAFWEQFPQTGFAHTGIHFLSNFSWKTDEFLGLATDAALAETSGLTSTPRLLPPSTALMGTMAYGPSSLDEGQWLPSDASGIYPFPFTEAIDDILYEEQVCGATAAEPGGQTLGIADSVALRLPQLDLPSDNQSATASGCDPWKVLTGVGAGTTESKAVPKAPGKRRNPSARRTRQIGVRSRADKPSTKFVCKECTTTRGYTYSFNSQKDLRRHEKTTKAHNARAVAQCSCGKRVTRKDAKPSHRRYCPRGSWTDITA